MTMDCSPEFYNGAFVALAAQREGLCETFFKETQVPVSNPVVEAFPVILEFFVFPAFVDLIPAQWLLFRDQVGQEHVIANGVPYGCIPIVQ